jgi:hypothetical protein
MDLPHYELDSLVYLSTDIVLADISKDTRGNFTATVTEALYGSLQPGVKLDALTPFLMFFQPLNDGQKVILFLDRRAHQYDFFHQDAAKSPFAVPPSGAYLIDEYGHVHEYFQQNNPGPYVAQGYTFFFDERQVPTEKDDLTLPSLQEVKGQIAAALKSVIPVRNFLDQPTKAADVPALMKLLVARPRVRETCGSGPQSGPSRVLPIDNDWLSPSADQILATAKAIFNNPAEDADLRALCLRLLDFNNRDNISDIQRVYGQTHSPKLQFAIEQTFLEVSDDLYQSLHPSSGPVASIIQLSPEHGCIQSPNHKIVFLTHFYSTRAFNDRGAAVTAGRMVLKNTKSGQRFELKNPLSTGGHWSVLDGVLGRNHTRWKSSPKRVQNTPEHHAVGAQKTPVNA